MIKFNIPPITGKEEQYISESIKNQKLSGDGSFTEKCNKWFENNFNVKKTLLTTSCTHALELAAILADIQPGDEVIMPSYTFVSTANAFVLRGAKVKFVDIRPDTMNIDEKNIEKAITSKTKAIVPVHYAGVSCEMDTIMSIANKYNLIVIEDAAQGVMSKYNERYLGTIGHIGCYSFHDTKNYTSGEGGALLINDERFIERAEIVREKGTNRSRFLRGQIDKYTWVDMGSSYLPSEINAAYLLAQLENANEINNNRLQSWEKYNTLLMPLKEKGIIELPNIPDNCQHNAHMFYIKVKNITERTELMEFLRNFNVQTAFHYVPLHSSPAGKKFSEFIGSDDFTTFESERLIRLPMYYGLIEKDIEFVCEMINKYYEDKIKE